MASYTLFLDWKNQYCQNDYTTQGNLQIQCSFSQISNGIFHKTKTKIFFTFIQKHKTPQQSKQSFERKTKWEQSGSLTSDYTTNLQKSKWYNTRTHKKNTIIGQRNRKESLETHTYGQFATKEARMYNGEKGLFNKWC